MFTFPTALFRPGSFKAELRASSISGGGSLSGLTQSANTSGGGFWSIEFGECDLWPDRDAQRVWNAFAARHAGGAVPIVVPICQRLDQPFLPGDVQKRPGTGFSDDMTFSDGATWAGGYITAALLGGAALRATTVWFSLAGASALLGGEWFTLWGPRFGQRLYSIVSASQNEDSSWTCEIRPPLREAAIAGTTLDFDNPRCQMQVAGNVARTTSLLRFGKGPGVTFVENFLPPGS